MISTNHKNGSALRCPYCRKWIGLEAWKMEREKKVKNKKIRTYKFKTSRGWVSWKA